MAINIISQLTCVILGVLRFDFQGSLYLDFQGDNSLTWPQGASLTQIRLSTPSSIEAYTNHSLNISGDTVLTSIIELGSKNVKPTPNKLSIGNLPITHWVFIPEQFLSEFVRKLTTSVQWES